MCKNGKMILIDNNNSKLITKPTSLLQKNKFYYDNTTPFRG